MSRPNTRLMSMGSDPSLKSSAATRPSANGFTQMEACPSLYTFLAWRPRGSWLMARISGAFRMDSVALLIVLGSLPSMSGDASMHHSAKCAFCSVCVRPPTTPQRSRLMNWPGTQPGICSGQSWTTPKGLMPSRPTTSMSGSLKPPGPAYSLSDSTTSKALVTGFSMTGSLRRAAAALSHTANRSASVRQLLPTLLPQSQGFPVPQEHRENRIGLPVAFSARDIRA
mmetsp:Transcript_12728/g.34696  ORF Transcript_12728/g.34696 Transcript_12728/m.34696 type:complete len:226 (-) Transcript_12728:509-1186(-)